MRKNLKINLRRKVTQLSATFFTLLLVSVSCKKELTSVGDNLANTELNHTIVDTFSMVTYSELLDTLESDETSISLLGAYIDPIFGRVDCGFVTQLVPDTYNPVFPAAPIVDSVVLALQFSSIEYYADLTNLNVEVYEISDVLIRADQEYYTKTVPNIVGSDLVKVGSSTIRPDIVKDVVVGNDTISAQFRINLKTSLGDQLIAIANSGGMNESFQSSAFKGLYVKTIDPIDGNGTVLYFSLEDILSKLTVYYHIEGGATEFFDLDINSECARYNSIQFDRAGTDVQAVLDNTLLGQEKFYTQGSAIRSIIKFPHILNLRNNVDGETDPKIINQAVLVLPVQDFVADPFNPSARLFIGRIVDNELSTFTSDYGFGSTINDNTEAYDDVNKEYRFDMTQEIQGLLLGDIENVGYRVYSSAFFGSTIERIIFNGSKSNLKNKPRLEITYTEY